MARISKRPGIWPLALYGFCICVLAALILPGFSGGQKNPQAPPTLNDLILETENPRGLPAAFILNTHGKPDQILEAYRNPESRESVEEFFAGICGSSELASVILFYASEYNIPPTLAFSLCWEESRFYPRAVNRKNRNLSVDRGLFQLNNATFPMLTEQDFFDPGINARYGLSHLRWCLDFAGTEVAGLAMYNAGTGRVRSGETPKTTLDYVSRILNRQRQTEELFLVEYIEPEVEIVIIPEEETRKFTLSLLTPLGRR